MSTNVRACMAVALSFWACACGGKSEVSSSPGLSDASVSDSPSETAPQNDASDAQGMCFADFPCRQGETIRCSDATHYRNVQTHDCHYTCGPGPCSGGTCDAVGEVQACPAGEACIHGAGYNDFDHCGLPDAGADAQPDAAPAQCGDGFCRPAVMSSCGDPSAFELPMWECTTESSDPGYCCLPKSNCVSGYCTTTSECKAPLMLTQVGCQVDGGPGSCCVEPK